jgi:hypothetical protein
MTLEPPRARTSPQHPIPSGFGANTTAREVIGERRLDGTTAIVTGGYAARVDGSDQKGVQLARVERQRTPHELVDEPGADVRLEAAAGAVAAEPLPKLRGLAEVAKQEMTREQWNVFPGFARGR